jgi:hypothetical protein
MSLVEELESLYPNFLPGGDGASLPLTRRQILQRAHGAADIGAKHVTGLVLQAMMHTILSSSPRQLYNRSEGCWQSDHGHPEPDQVDA